MAFYSTCNCRTRPNLDEKYPPNETPAAIALWNLATIPDETIPGGTLFVAKWSNGHYGPPETTGIELLPTDDIGPDFTCERRVLIPAQQNPRPLTADDGMLSRAVLEARKHKGTALALHSEVQAIVNAALTEPKPQPEGAAALADAMEDYSRDGLLEEYGLDGLADHLATLGYRKDQS